MTSASGAGIDPALPCTLELRTPTLRPSPKEYWQRFPAKIFHIDIDPEDFQFFVEHDGVFPAYSSQGFFKANWPQQLMPLPSPEVFIQQQAFSPLVNSACPLNGCDQQFFYAGDLQNHITSNHKGVQLTNFVCKCGREWKSCDDYQCHVNGRDGMQICPQHKNDPLYAWNPNKSTGDAPPPGVAYFLCEACPDQYFVTRRDVDSHISQMHKGTSVNWNDGIFCLPVEAAGADDGTADSDSEASATPVAANSKGLARKAKGAASTIAKVGKKAGKKLSPVVKRPSCHTHMKLTATSASIARRVSRP